jgi:DNA polymerase-3 subunit delta'
MRLAGVMGQDRAVEALERAFVSGRFHPSLIFHGPQGSGKLTAALALARALLCATPADGAPCGACSACRRIEARSLRHPSVRVIFPEKKEDLQKGSAAPEGVSGIDLQERQATAARNPTWAVLIDRVRETIAFVQRRPPEGSRTILLVDQAHRLSGESGNAFLKTLEEPPDHAILILLTHEYHSLLPTIRSRCRAVPFQAVPPEAIAAWLAAEKGLPQQEARLRAGLAGGRIGAACDLDLDAFRERRETILRRLESFLRPPDYGQAVARAEEIARAGEGSTDDLELLAGLLRDRMLLDAAGDDAPGLIHADIAPRLRALALRVDGDGTGALAALEAAIDAIRRKGHRQLQIENALLEMLPSPGVPGPTRRDPA